MTLAQLFMVFGSIIVVAVVALYFTGNSIFNKEGDRWQRQREKTSSDS